MAKVLVVGLSNSGKTTLLKSLKNCLVISRDGKKFPFHMPHYNVIEFEGMDHFLDLLSSKLNEFREKFGKEPDTIAIDSVSRIFTDVETYCNRKYKGFEVWNNVNREIQMLVDAINDLEQSFNVVLIAHCTWDEKSNKFVETCKGSFAKIGGFLSTVDYAVNIDMVGKKRIVTHRNSSLSRTLLDDLPDSQNVEDFNLQQYLDKINAATSDVEAKWSL